MGTARKWIGGAVLVGLGYLLASGLCVAVQRRAPVNPGGVLVAAEPDYDAARAAYTRDRDAARRTKPGTEAALVALFGRAPDAIIESGGMTMLSWYYATKPAAEGQSTITASVQGGKVTGMAF